MSVTRLTAGLVVLLVVGGLAFWSGWQTGRQGVPVGPEVTPSPTPVSEAEVLAGCERIYDDYLEATEARHQRGEAVCGLDISGENFVKLIGGIEELGDLTVLLAADNNIETVPEWIGELQRLELLDLSNNKIKFLRPELGTLRNLKILDLTGNPLAPGDVARLRTKIPEAEVRF